MCHLDTAIKAQCVSYTSKPLSQYKKKLLFLLSYCPCEMFEILLIAVYIFRSSDNIKERARLKSLQCQSVSHSLTDIFLSQNSHFIYRNGNMIIGSSLMRFQFVTQSDSLGCTFWLITQEYSFLQKIFNSFQFSLHLLKNRNCAILQTFFQSFLWLFVSYQYHQ